MRRIEAKWLLLRDLVAWRRRPYDELRALIDRGHNVEVRGRSGTEYQVEIEAVWDTKPGGDFWSWARSMMGDGERAAP